MAPHQERVVEEKKALDEKLEKLQAFTNARPFQNLDEVDRILLLNQLSVMEWYSSILYQRIERFK